MSKALNIPFDSETLEQISSEFDLRGPNHDALRKLAYEIDGGYDPQVMQVMSLATGVGKTYLMAAFIEYLRRNGVGNVMIVTPGKTVQAKTVQNFTPGSPRYIAGSPVPPEVVVPQDYSQWRTRLNGPDTAGFGRNVPVLAFIFNIQQLIAPKSDEGETKGSGADAMRRKPRRFVEDSGSLFDYLKSLDDLVVIADESHLYSASAVAFNAALKELDPALAVGLTASASKSDHVIFTYPLYQAIDDEFVKRPVLAFRKDGYGVDGESEEQQLRDAKELREIKQRYYDLYTQANGLEHVNAVMFVVCADVDHATQVTELLRSPRYFGSDFAVLQVDSKHDDDTTQRFLERLDYPDSPVLAVVSVNKLKEGWDVKNIAVVVTLRAMASEVLTQQTMGRGLRLPFGKYTGVLQIDQLDIISHQSFRELLKAENILQQFGLEDAVTDAQRPQIQQAIERMAKQGASSNTGGEPSAPNWGQAGAASVAGAPVSPGEASYLEQQGDAGDEGFLPTLGVRTILGQSPAAENVPQLPLLTVKRNPKYADVSYTFPGTKVNVTQPQMLLSAIDRRDIERAAARVTSTGDVLIRKEIVTALGGSIKAVDTESAEVASKPVPREDVENALVKLVLGNHLIPVTQENTMLARNYLVKRFMEGVTFDEWTVKSLASANSELNILVREFAGKILRARHEETSIVPRTMPGTTELIVPISESIHEPLEVSDHKKASLQFVRGRFYSGWFKSLYEAESFDSYKGEYLLARLLNTSPHIQWWHRLHPQDGALIFYNAKDRYFPDFVALDTDGIYWIIEGKNQGGRADDTVQAKRKAAEEIVNRLIGEPKFIGQKWGYLIGYEDDVLKAESWDDLKTMAQPVSNA